MSNIYSVVPRLISNQTVFTGKDLSESAKESFSLGYMFGMAEMAVYQSGVTLEDQAETLSAIHRILSDALDTDASDVVLLAIRSQQNDEFANGREVGSNDLGQWIKTKGQYVPMGLVNTGS
ncbi:hypothetical protein [Falsiruegeria mediterranea]|uniref:hypothetical protein n=1 Tax=Falsiruegeria mediterranea TaxID=1280832 RepID=UPI0015F274AB|nr:hypothetical protein [Falsiruegeria mediterranea]